MSGPLLSCRVESAQNGGVPKAEAAFSIGTAKPMPTKKR
jgi:hypothetical protein